MTDNPKGPSSEAKVPVLAAVVLDRSGSMDVILDDTTGGFNALRREQREEGGEVTLPLAQFDHEYELVHDGVPIAEVPDLNRATFVPRGFTALLDAMGRMICDVDARLAKMGDPKPIVLLAIITDGAENASKEFSLMRVNEMVTARRTQGWNILFLGATADSIRTAHAAGVAGETSVRFAADGAGIQDSLGGTVHRSIRAASTGRSIAGAIVEIERRN